MAESKQIWRRTYLASRAARRVAHSRRPVTLRDIRTILQAIPRSATIAGYLPLSSEVDVLPLLREWVEGGGAALVPTPAALTSGGRSSPQWQRLSFQEGEDGCEEQTPECASGTGDGTPPGALSEAALILIPGLVFGRDGRRLGRGAGWYDRALSQATQGAILVGVCHAGELVEAMRVPIEEHDRLMDFVLTPTELVICRRTNL